MAVAALSSRSRRAQGRRSLAILIARPQAPGELDLGPDRDTSLPQGGVDVTDGGQARGDDDDVRLARFYADHQRIPGEWRDALDGRLWSRVHCSSMPPSARR